LFADSGLTDSGHFAAVLAFRARALAQALQFIVIAGVQFVIPILCLTKLFEHPHRVQLLFAVGARHFGQLVIDDEALMPTLMRRNRRENSLFAKVGARLHRQDRYVVVNGDFHAKFPVYLEPDDPTNARTNLSDTLIGDEPDKRQHQAIDPRFDHSNPLLIERRHCRVTTRLTRCKAPLHDVGLHIIRAALGEYELSRASGGAKHGVEFSLSGYATAR
jgi:hypothetical protein